MLKKRIIPCLDIKNGRTVKGVNFIHLKDAGDPVELAAEYARQGADELVFLDISATNERRKTLLPLVERIAAKINIPFTVGGGISCIEDVTSLTQVGADKVCLNSAAVLRPGLVSEIAAHFGSQCVVVAIDAKYSSGEWNVFINGGTVPAGYSIQTWAKQAEQLGAGELLITSMSHDGVKTGFAYEMIGEIAGSVNIPVIASGGAGSMYHFQELFENTNVSAALAASVFHFKEIIIPELKLFLKNNKISIR